MVSEVLKALKEIFKNSGYGVLYLNKKGFIKDANPAFTKITGVKKKDVIDKHAVVLAKKYLDKKDVGQIVKKIKDRFLGKEVSDYIIHFNGKVLKVASPYKGAGDMGYIAFLQDVTEQKKAEEDKQSMTGFTEEDVDPVYRVSKDGVLLYANPASRQLLETRTEVGTKIPKKWVKMIKDVYDSGKKQTAEVELSGRTFLFSQVPILEKGYVNAYATDITEKKKAEEALKESESRYRELYEKSIALNILLSMDGRILDLNDSFLKILGYEKKDLVGKHMSEFIAPEDRESAMRALKNSQPGNEGLTPEMELDILGSDGSYHSILYSRGHTVIHENGKPAGILITGIDISDRKKIEGALKQASEDYDDITNLSGDIIVKSDADGKYTFVNDYACGFFGAKRECIVGKPFLDFVHPEDTKMTVGIIRKAVAEKRTERGLINRQKTNEGYKTVEWHGMPKYDEDGKYIGFQASGRDITEKQKAELALKESEQKLRSIIEHSQDVFFMQDVNNLLTYVSPQSLSIFGYTPEEMKIKWTKLITGNPINQKGIELTEKALKTGEKQEPYILETKTKDGTFRFVEVDESPVKDEEGTVVGLSGALTDVTDNKKAEEALKESEQKYRLLSDNIKQGLFSVDKGSFVSVNKAMSDIFGFSENELIGRQAWKLAKKEIRHETRRKFIEKIKKRDPSGIVVECTRKDGSQLIAEISVNVNPDTRYIYGLVTDITEKKRSEEALKESEDRFRSLFEYSADAIFMADPKTKRLVDCNEKALELSGYTKKEILKMRADQLHPKDALKETMEAFKRQAESDLSVVNSFLLTKKGKRVPVGINSKKVTIAGKAVLQGIFRDITQQRRSEKEIAGLAAEYKAILETSGDALMVLSPKNLRFKTANPAAIKMFRAKKEEDITTKNPFDLSPSKQKNGKESFKEAKARVDKCMKEGSNLFEWRHKRLNGQEFDAEVRLTRFKQGDKILIQSSVRDITEKKKFEESISESENKYRTLWESSRDAIMTLAPPTWVFTSGNPATIKMFNCKDEKQFASLCPWQLSPEFQPDGQASAEKSKAMIIKAMNEGSNFFEWIHQRYNGENFPATVMLTKVELEKGKPFLQATIRDVTAEKKAEEDLRKKAEDLEKFNKFAVDREMRMVQIKKELKELKNKMEGGK